MSNTTVWMSPLLKEAIILKTKIQNIKGISVEMLSQYIETRRRIDAEANSIFSITSMFALLETCGDDKLEVDPVAIGKIHQTLNKNILNIWEILDDFIYIVKAKSVLDETEE